jgi:hypothetical protein
LSRAATIKYKDTDEPEIFNFSKATFKSEDDDIVLDIDDENFWDKVLPQGTTPRLLKNRLENGPLDSNEAKEEFLDDLLTLVKQAKHANQLLGSMPLEGSGKDNTDYKLIELCTLIEASSMFTDIVRITTTLTYSCSKNRGLGVID